MIRKYSNTKSDERGVVAIMMTIIITIIITLTALSFSLLMRREETQAFDRQLSSQAFYAAESGVNDAKKAIETNALAVGNITDCSAGSLSKISSGVKPPTIDTNVKYTCVFVNQTPTVLTSTIPKDSSKIFRIDTNPSGAAKTLTVTWQDSVLVSPVSYPSYGGPTGSFPPESYWSSSSPPLLAIQLVPELYGGAAARTAIVNKTLTFYAFPSAFGSAPVSNTIVYNGGTTSGAVVGGSCLPVSGGPATCSAVISTLPVAGSPFPTYYLRIRPMYRSANVTVSAKSSAGNALLFSGAQAIIDSTGIAQDVLKRIKVTVAIGAGYTVPDYVISSGDDLCKQLVVSLSSILADGCTSATPITL